jgi:transposase
MWTNANRVRYDRSRLRYPSDLTDAEWAHVAPLIPPAKRGGNRRHVDEREVVNGLMYILSTGCQWRAIPKDLPARSTLYDYFDLWNWDGTLVRIHEALYVKCRGRPRARRAPPPRSSTARTSRAQKKILCGWTAARLGRLSTQSRRQGRGFIASRGARLAF